MMIDVKTLNRAELEDIIRGVLEYNQIAAGDVAFCDASGAPLDVQQIHIACTPKPLAVRTQPEERAKTLGEIAAAFSVMPIDPKAMPQPASMLELSAAMEA